MQQINDHTPETARSCGFTKPPSNTRPMDLAPAAEENLKKLTVSQLKALCKENQIVGYSKATKPILIQKLLEHASRTSSTPNLSATTRAKKSSDASLTHDKDEQLSKAAPATRNPSASASEPSSRLLTPPPSQNAATSFQSACRQSSDVNIAVNSSNLHLSNAHITTSLAGVHRPILKSNASSNAVCGEKSQTTQHANAFGATSLASFTGESHKAGESRDITPSHTLHSVRPAVPFEAARASVSDPAFNFVAQTSLKRRLSIFETKSGVLTKKTKLAHAPRPFLFPVTHGTVAATCPSSSAFKSPKHPMPGSTTLATRPIPDGTTGDIHSSTETLTNATSGKRFTPLTFHKKATKSFANPAAQTYNNSGSNSRPKFSPSVLSKEMNSEANFSLYHLDFPVTPPITLSRITLPPSLSQRKQVTRFALILSRVAKEDLSQCALVSRMFRYATYLSATIRLKRDFPGRRLDALLQRVPSNMTNLWPYLRQREEEANLRRRIFNKSFLGRILRNKIVIASRIWTSPDNDKQIGVALRFLLTRLFFSVSVSREKNGLAWLQGMIIDVQEIIKGEVWCIFMQQPSSLPCTESFYVLESTCEVIGLASPSLDEIANPLKPCPVRADWLRYIAERTSHRVPESTSVQIETPELVVSLMDRLNWANHEEYEHGISKLWLKRIDGEGDVGKEKKALAERYVLACVVGNSVSGRWMSSTQMAQDFLGLPTTLLAASASKNEASSVHLFLPAHHHVESVHFTTSEGLPLHPALAVVQTPGREYFVLRDNGMQVGCEEDGIADVWMRIIGCTTRGETEQVEL